MAAIDLLTAWLQRQAEPQGFAWLSQQRQALRAQPTGRALAIAFGFAPRKVGKAVLHLSADDLAAAQQARAGWRPQGLTADQAARILLLLEVAHSNDVLGANDFPARLKALLTTADLAEQIAVQRGLPLYPNPEALTLLAIESLRSAVRAVFESVAHDNPFPAEQFGEDAWNQMVLKALFIGAALDPVVGLDDRWNPALARMLLHYADERSAAGRAISPELWRGVGRFADADVIERLATTLASDAELERQGAALALWDAGDAGRERLRAKAPQLAQAAQAGQISWRAIGDQVKSA